MIVTGLAKSPSIGIITETSKQQKIDIDEQAASISNFSADVSIQKSEQGKIMFTGKKRLVFGVEIFELEYSPVNKRFRMKLVEEAFKIRKPGEEKDHKVLKPVFIENKEDDEGFMISE